MWRGGGGGGGGRGVYGIMGVLIGLPSMCVCVTVCNCLLCEHSFFVHFFQTTSKTESVW